MINLRVFRRLPKKAGSENFNGYLPEANVHTNEAGGSPSCVSGYERGLLQHLLSGGEVLEVVRDALLLSSNKLHQEQQTLEDLNNKNDSAKKCMETLECQIAQIIANAQQELEGMECLRGSLMEIQHCVSDINRISQQTDLLAINSAIEAAHVSKDGRGFSVIAKEIKMLSSQVQHQSAEIVSLTDGISGQTQQLCKGVMLQVPLVKQMQNDIHEASLMLDQVIRRSARMQSIISIIATQQFLNTVKMDHVIWKYQIYRYMLDRASKATVNTHIECRLGKWYYGKEGQRYATYSAFPLLEQPHAQVHSSGREAMNAFFNDEYDNMEQALGRMESASHLVVSLIDDLLKQVSSDVLSD